MYLTVVVFAVANVERFLKKKKMNINFKANNIENSWQILYDFTSKNAKKK